MDPLGDLLITRPIQTGWEFTIEPYPSWQFGLIDNKNSQFGNSSGWTRTRTQTRNDGPELLIKINTTNTKPINKINPEEFKNLITHVIINAWYK